MADGVLCILLPRYLTSYPHHTPIFISIQINKSKFASVEFKALSEKDKAKWDKLAAADKERYLAEMETYSPPHGY